MLSAHVRKRSGNVSVQKRSVSVRICGNVCMSCMKEKFPTAQDRWIFLNITENALNIHASRRSQRLQQARETIAKVAPCHPTFRLSRRARTQCWRRCGAEWRTVGLWSLCGEQHIGTRARP
jgi:hypothetical protein